MKELIDRQEVIKHIGDCLDDNGYVDTTKFAKCMRKILNMPYETKESISDKAIDEFVRAINSRLLQFVPTDYDDILFIAEQLKKQNND